MPFLDFSCKYISLCNNLLEMYKIYWDNMNSSDMPTQKIIFWNEGGFSPSFLLANSLQKKLMVNSMQFLTLQIGKNHFIKNKN